MGVVKTASESILEETVVPSEEANYSLQGHAGKATRSLFLLLLPHLVLSQHANRYPLLMEGNSLDGINDGRYSRCSSLLRMRIEYEEEVRLAICAGRGLAMTDRNLGYFEKVAWKRVCESLL
ncbi:hypothetical protein KM043_013683 [Ampulex compressa]|nr:hypothetical protein KM043_013683 [Ampulex compressa]